MNKAFPFSLLNFILGFFITCASISCGNEKARLPDPPVSSASFRLDTIVNGLEIPWGMTFLPNGDMLITEKVGRINRFDGKMVHPLKNVPSVNPDGQGGMLDIELHPDYEQNGWIYFSYSKPGEDPKMSTTAIMRARLRSDSLVDQQLIFVALEESATRHHYGSRLEFDREGYLFFSVGERGDWDNAQKLTNHLGKIHRIKDDGSIPDDNPFLQESGAMPSIYTFGNRNPQGLAMHPQTGVLWEHEHGPMGGDEVNIIEKGINYGWPRITYGVNYNGDTISRDTAQKGMAQPFLYWRPSIAPCGMTFVTSDKYPQWKGDILVGSMKFNYLHRIDLNGNQLAGQEKLIENAGRVRCVEESPDGFLYYSLDSGPIVKIVPL